MQGRSKGLGKPSALPDIDAAETITNHRTIVAKPKTGEIVIWSLEHPNQTTHEKQKNRTYNA